MAANPSVIQGLSPFQRLDGAKWSDRLRIYFVPAANTNALYVGDPVVKISGSADVNGINGVDLAAAGSANKVTGAICGFLGTATAGSGNTPSFWGLASTPGPAYRPASTALDWYVLVNDDPEAAWLIQADNNYGGVAGTAMPVTVVGKNINLKSGTGSAYTGWSGWTADSNSTGTGATLQLNIIAFHTDAVNSAANTNQKLVVRLNTSTEITGQAGI